MNMRNVTTAFELEKRNYDVQAEEETFRCEYVCSWALSLLRHSARSTTFDLRRLLFR